MFDEPKERRAPERFRGTVASAGVAEGWARIIPRLDEAKRSQSRDVLACRTMVDPWTPLFAIAEAIVTNMGGTLSHSAIVARECATCGGEAVSYVAGIDKRISLIDGERLAELMFDSGLGVTVTETLELKQLDLDYFDES